MLRKILILSILLSCPKIYGAVTSIFSKTYTDEERKYSQRDLYRNNQRGIENISPVYGDSEYNALFGKKIAAIKPASEPFQITSKAPNEEDMPNFDTQPAQDDFPNFSSAPPPDDGNFFEDEEFYYDDEPF
ncbi:MAG: hypothetical protein LBR35_01260 [Rickettsiales bacterium]|jgi:hypothetical protein|nr:hypothetical protein [Rickettsiales bacterium]